MSTFPTALTTTAHLDSDQDAPLNARQEIYNAFQLLNQLIQSYNQMGGICGLNAAGKVDAQRLIGVVDSSQLALSAVETDRIADGAVNFLKLKATLTSDSAAPTGGNDGDIHIIYEV